VVVEGIVMKVRARGLLAVLALSTGLAAVPVGPPVSADPISRLTSEGLPYVVFIVKDMGGGAYWNVTTSAMYAVATGSELLITGAQTGADLLATLASNGRDLLLVINGAVLRPVQDALG
jgi:hypothetical protein